jgi:diguanylate cyclase (GGDEF)-like protein
MNEQTFGGSSFRALSIILVSSFALTLLMSFVGAYERLYQFTQMHKLYTLDEFAVFMPSFLAMGFVLLSYQKIKDLELEIGRREEIEAALRDSESKYKTLSITDDLTGLYNSRHFYDQLQIEMDRSVRYDHPLSLMILDIDDFKLYNDTYGHLEGDNVLASFGKNLVSGLRTVDSAFRYGGEEFTVILPETEVKKAARTAERIRKKFEAEILKLKTDEKVRCTVSIGVSQYRPGEDCETFARRVDGALYMAKEQGKNRISSLK